jgi:FtsH-binding integral membrane protein
MKNRSSILPVLLPVFSIIGVAAWAIGLGVLFIALNETDLGVFGAIIGGLLLIIVIPTIAWIFLGITDKTKKEQS